MGSNLARPLARQRDRPRSSIGGSEVAADESIEAMVSPTIGGMEPAAPAARGSERVFVMGENSALQALCDNRFR
jgi:hypothetical protein